MKSLKLWLCLFLLPAVADAATEGIYSGTMTLTDGTERIIPLDISLVTTNESVETPNGSQYIIDGSCVIDEEGGPYTFVKVTYDIDDNIIDLRYSRPRNDPTTHAPSSFRLNGKFVGDDKIEGRVMSGIYGVIGSFSVSKDASRRSLTTKTKYLGTWTGIGFNHFTNTKVPITVFVGKGATTTQNPPDHEFEYTPARTGGFKIANANIARFSVVAIDYLRRKMLLQDNEATISLTASIDFEAKTLSGIQYSAMHGQTTSFEKLPLTGIEVPTPQL